MSWRRLNVSSWRVKEAALSQGSLDFLEVLFRAGRGHPTSSSDSDSLKPIRNGQDVIEIVRHAAGQPAHRFHLLRLQQLLFATAPLLDLLVSTGRCVLHAAI